MRRGIHADEEEKLPGDIFRGDFCTFFGSYNMNDLSQREKLDESKLNDVVLPKN
jgi:hypothetical protein